METEMKNKKLCANEELEINSNIKSSRKNKSNNANTNTTTITSKYASRLVNSPRTGKPPIIQIKETIPAATVDNTTTTTTTTTPLNESDESGMINLDDDLIDSKFINEILNSSTSDMQFDDVDDVDNELQQQQQQQQQQQNDENIDDIPAKRMRYEAHHENDQQQQQPQHQDVYNPYDELPCTSQAALQQQQQQQQEQEQQLIKLQLQQMIYQQTQQQQQYDDAYLMNTTKQFLRMCNDTTTTTNTTTTTTTTTTNELKNQSNSTVGYENLTIYNVPSLLDNNEENEMNAFNTISSQAGDEQQYVYEITTTGNEERQQQVLAEILSQAGYTNNIQQQQQQQQQQQSQPIINKKHDVAGINLLSDDDMDLLEFDFSLIDTVKTPANSNYQSARKYEIRSKIMKYGFQHKKVYTYTHIPRPMAMNRFNMSKLPKSVASVFHTDLLTTRKANDHQQHFTQNTKMPGIVRRFERHSSSSSASSSTSTQQAVNIKQQQQQQQTQSNLPQFVKPLPYQQQQPQPQQQHQQQPLQHHYVGGELFTSTQTTSTTSSKLTPMMVAQRARSKSMHYNPLGNPNNNLKTANIFHLNEHYQKHQLVKQKTINSLDNKIVHTTSSTAKITSTPTTITTTSNDNMNSTLSNKLNANNGVIKRSIIANGALLKSVSQQKTDNNKIITKSSIADVLTDCVFKMPMQPKLFNKMRLKEMRKRKMKQNELDHSKVCMRQNLEKSQKEQQKLLAKKSEKMKKRKHKKSKLKNVAKTTTTTTTSTTTTPTSTTTTTSGIKLSASQQRHVDRFYERDERMLNASENNVENKIVTQQQQQQQQQQQHQSQAFNTSKRQMTREQQIQNEAFKRERIRLSQLRKQNELQQQLQQQKVPPQIQQMLMQQQQQQQEHNKQQHQQQQQQQIHRSVTQPQKLTQFHQLLLHQQQQQQQQQQNIPQLQKILIQQTQLTN